MRVMLTMKRTMMMMRMMMITMTMMMTTMMSMTMGMMMTTMIMMTVITMTMMMMMMTKFKLPAAAGPVISCPPFKAAKAETPTVFHFLSWR